MKKARKHQEKRRNFLYRERESQNTTPLQQGYAAGESIYCIETTRAAETYLYRNEIRREDKSRSGRRTQTRLSGQEGRGAASRQGVLITWKGLDICCNLWMWYIFTLTRNLNSILIRTENAS